MKSNLKFFKTAKSLPVDKFFQNILYDNKFGYYATRQPFGKKGDFITSPKISNLFSEIIAIWIISSWELFGKPNNFNIVELGPGDGSLIRILLESFKKFPEFNSVKKIFLYEESSYLRKIQKKNILSKDIKEESEDFYYSDFFIKYTQLFAQFNKFNNNFTEKIFSFSDESICVFPLIKYNYQ